MRIEKICETFITFGNRLTYILGYDIFRSNYFLSKYDDTASHKRPLPSTTNNELFDLYTIIMKNKNSNYLLP